VQGKPLALVNGANLLHLLGKHGYRARIDLKQAKEDLGNRDRVPKKPSELRLAFDHREELGELVGQFACLGFVFGALALLLVTYGSQFSTVAVLLPAQGVAQLAHLAFERGTCITLTGRTELDRSAIGRVAAQLLPHGDALPFSR
jgi:hypothetical protein